MYFKSLLVFLTVALTACDKSDKEAGRTFEDVMTSGELIIATRNAPTTWFLDRHGEPSGYEYDLARYYSETLGLKPRFVVKDNIQDIFRALESGEADIAAAGLTLLPSREERFLVGPSYKSVHQSLVCHRDGFKPTSFAEISSATIKVVAGSSYSSRLNELKASEYPELSWQETEKQSTEQLLEKVANKKIDCTVADSNIVKINLRFFPQLAVTMKLSKTQDIVLYLPKHHQKLKKQLDHWFRSFKKSDDRKVLQDRHYGFFKEFDYVDISVFKRRIDDRLPKYKRHFKSAAKKYDLPMLTLISQSYQESHWEPNAKSPTGVRGMMMLTKNTAKSLGIDDRLNPKQSIFGGAQYLNKMWHRFKDEVPEDDRLKLALAAYNIGRAHMHDAQQLARKLGRSPYHWYDMQHVLPLLSQKKYYKNLKYGYARGTEPVRYVQRIFEYQHILRRELN
jgi:membrane-bound lytic murein transglycosylase F